MTNFAPQTPDFNALPVPANYVPGSLRGDKGFRTSAEHVVGAPVTFSKAELNIIRELSVLHGKEMSAEVGNKTEQAVEPTLKQGSRDMKMPGLHDIGQRHKLKTEADKNEYICYVVAGDPNEVIDNLSGTALGAKDDDYLTTVTKLEWECTHNPSILSLWISLTKYYYEAGNLQMAANTAARLMDQIDAHNAEQLWSLVLSDSSVPMRALLEYYDFRQINDIFGKIAVRLQQCILADDGISAAQKRALSDCRSMVLCANAFCMLLAPAEESSLSIPLVYAMVRDLNKSSNNDAKTCDYCYYVAISSVLYTYVQPTILSTSNGDGQSDVHSKDTASEEYSNYKELIRSVFTDIDDALFISIASNPLVRAYIFAEALVAEQTEHLALIAYDIIKFPCAGTKETGHSSQLYRLFQETCSLVLTRSNLHATISFTAVLALIEELMLDGSELRSIVLAVMERTLPLPLPRLRLRLQLLNSALSKMGEREKHYQLLLMHLAKLLCTDVVKAWEGTGPQEVPMPQSLLYEFLLCATSIYKHISVPIVMDWISRYSAAEYALLRPKGQMQRLQKVKIGMLLLQWRSDKDIMEQVFRYYKHTVLYAKDKRATLQSAINTLPRVENLLIQAPSDDLVLEILIFLSTNGTTGSFQGTLKKAVLLTHRHLLPFNARTVSILFTLAQETKWLDEHTLSLFKAANNLLSEQSTPVSTETSKHLLECAKVLLRENSDADIIFTPMVMALEVLHVPKNRGITMLKNHQTEYVESPWTPALMAMFLCESKRGKADTYWAQWIGSLENCRLSLLNQRAAANLDALLCAIKLCTTHQERLWGILTIASLFLFYSHNL